MKTILVGIDFSKSSENALNYAILLAKNSKSKILLFHALKTPVLHTNSGLFFIDEDYLSKETTQKIEKLHLELAKKHKDITFDVAITHKGFKHEVEKLSEKNKINLVVIGLETKSRISKFIYGTTSIDLAGKINCPIITVPEAYKQHTLKKMLIALDNKETISSSLSKRIHTTIKYLKVKPEFVHIKTEDELDLLQKVNPQLEVTNVKAKDFQDGIRAYSKKSKADLVMLISHNYNAFYSLFMDSNSKKVILSISLPVISIHK